MLPEPLLVFLTVFIGSAVLCFTVPTFVATVLLPLLFGGMFVIFFYPRPPPKPARRQRKGFTVHFS